MATMTRLELRSKGVNPGLTVNDLKKSIRFYTEGLGFGLDPRPNMQQEGRFAMLVAGNASLGLGQDDFAKGRDRVKGTGMRLWIETSQDIRALSEQVKRAGYSLDSEPEKMPWGPLAFSLTDPDGFKLTVSEEM
jgi:uncharacterized glyoxalase superfamily protein PhnB